MIETPPSAVTSELSISEVVVFPIVFVACANPTERAPPPPPAPTAIAIATPPASAVMLDASVEERSMLPP